ncbi:MULTISPECIES: hypothetical protein [unclassified Nocardioides]|uniref:hypothetical protein n=1 Tax=unclassified Nocardioides TaxID=2615069 RepID=UPI0000570D3F|nr:MULTISPECIES: hypothetical protein [unclassified Nocardioides]ABL79835.1 hypothetical protein Noca_0290 [Nocardioides sp. JS614]
MPHRIPRRTRLALGAVKLTVVAATVVAGLSTPVTQAGAGYAGHRVGEVADLPSPVARILAKHDCSTSGFADAAPASAVIRTATGRFRHVSFDEGWAVYTRRGAASLVAVCLDRAPEDREPTKAREPRPR